MASSIAHLAIINELIKLRSFKSEDRLKLGAVLADFGIRRETHLQIRLQNGNERTYDLNRFRVCLKELDALYSGGELMDMYECAWDGAARSAKEKQ